MKNNVQINLKKNIDDSYKIFIGNNFLNDVGPVIHELLNSNCYIIISDSNVMPIYGETVKKSLLRKNCNVMSIKFKAGEKYKTRLTKSQIEDSLLKNKIGRDSCILALGGGVTGDIAGFVAANYLRGIPFVQIPTTLLSQSDSSIGGKVAVDTSFAKNMIGAFYQPKAVFIDVSTLKTLPVNLRLNGIAEIIKHGIIMDSEYFDFIEKNSDNIKSLNEDAMMFLIKRSCEIKGSIVEKDEKEAGLRGILNFGHTIGHAVENLSNYKLLHDKCVSIGMHIESKFSYELGKMPKSDLDRITNILSIYNLPINIPKRMKIEDIIKKTFMDKKVKTGKVKYALPDKIGKTQYNIIVPDEIIKKVLKSNHY